MNLPPHIEDPQRPPDMEEVAGELDRMAIELEHAIRKHRLAWSKARKRMDELKAEQRRRHPEDYRSAVAMAAALAETDVAYKNAIGDVKFWCAERAAIASSMSALVAFSDHAHWVKEAAPALAPPCPRQATG